MFWSLILRIWGGLCLLFAALRLLSLLIPDVYIHLVSDGNLISLIYETNLVEWLGMGLPSLGLAHVIQLLESRK